MTRSTAVRIEVTEEGRDQGAIDLICNRSLGLKTPVSLGLIPRSDALGTLKNTVIGRAVLAFAEGDTSGDVNIADIIHDRKPRACITIQQPFGGTVALADLLEDILRLARQPESSVNPKNKAALLAEITRAFNRYLELMEQGGPPQEKVVASFTSPGHEQSLLWTYFDLPYFQEGPTAFTAEGLVPYFWNTVPWLAGLIEHLVKRKVIVGGDVATTTPKEGMRLFSVPVSAKYPTPEDCLDLIVTTAEAYVGITPTDDDIKAVVREKRWRADESPLTDKLQRVLCRWPIVLRELARREEQA